MRRTMHHHQVSRWRRRDVREHTLEGYDAEHRSSDPDVTLSVRDALALLTTRLLLGLGLLLRRRA